MFFCLICLDEKASMKVTEGILGSVSKAMERDLKSYETTVLSSFLYDSNYIQYLAVLYRTKI